MKTGTHPAPRRPGFPPARERRLCKGLRRRASRCLAGHSSRESSTPSVNLLGEASTPCHQPFRRGRHSLPSCPRKETLEQPSFPRRRESRGPAGHSSARHPHPAVHLLGEAATAYRHAREGGHPGVWRGTPLGRHPHPAVNPLPGRPPQPTVMPAEAGIQGLAGHSSREVSTPSVNPLPQPTVMHLIPPVNLLGEASIPAVDPFGEAATAYRHAREGGHPGSGGALYSEASTLRQALAQGRSNSLPKFHESKRPEGLDKA